ncbi:hypothetical protein DOJK_00362 [Patescibacteria group bacterium]|nr:hypothetical protein DOJK_00362 [Patescibacteria group bacterium]
MFNVKIAKLKEVNGFLAAALVDSSTGMVLDSVVAQDFPIDIAAAFNTQVVQAKLKAMDAIGLGDDVIEDILISLGSQYHLIRPLAANREMFMYLALDRKQVNLGMAKVQLRALEEA